MPGVMITETLKSHANQDRPEELSYSLFYAWTSIRTALNRYADDQLSACTQYSRCFHNCKQWIGKMINNRPHMDRVEDASSYWQMLGVAAYKIAGIFQLRVS